MKIAYVGNFTQTHCTEVHIAKTLESLGHEVTRIQETPDRRNEYWDGAVVGHDLFLYTRTWGKMVTLDDLEDIRQLGIPTASYHLDLYVGLQREEGLKDDPFWRTDYVFTPDGAESSAEVFKKYGINHHYIKPGVFKDECVMLPDNHQKGLGNDVIFVGSGNYMHKEWPYRNQLVTWLSKTFNHRYSKYGNPERTIRNMELNQLYANSGVVVGDSLCLGFNHPSYWSDRVYETLGRGGFIIHPFILGMEDEFEDAENIVFYEYGKFDQLKRLVDHYLEHPEQRELIRLAGHEFVKENATYHNRLTQALDIIFPMMTEAEIDFVLETTAPRYPYLSSTKGESMPMTDNVFDYKDMINLKINFGSGADPKEEYVNVDFINLPEVDLVHNLMEFPYPFSDNSAVDITVYDVLEHLDHYTSDKKPAVIEFVKECHRILKPGGRLFIQTPRYDAEFLWIDPTHVRGFHEESMDFFDPEKHYGQTTGFYSEHKFEVSCEILANKNLRFTMIKR